MQDINYIFIVMQIFDCFFWISVPEEQLVYRKQTMDLFRSVGTIGDFCLNIIATFSFVIFHRHSLTDPSCVPMERPPIFNTLAKDEMFLWNNEIH